MCVANPIRLQNLPQSVLVHMMQRFCSAQTISSVSQANQRLRQISKLDCMRKFFRIDLRPLASILDNQRLSIIAHTKFNVIEYPHNADGISRQRRTIREIDLSHSLVSNLGALNKAPRLDHVQLADMRFFVPAQQFRAELAPQLMWMKSLVTMSLANTATDDSALAFVAGHCPLLRSLDLSFCEKVTDAGLAMLLGIPAIAAGACLWKLILTGCICVEGYGMLRAESGTVPVLELRLGLTSVTAAFVSKCIRSPECLLIDIRVAPYVEHNEGMSLMDAAEKRGKVVLY